MVCYLDSQKNRRGMEVTIFKLGGISNSNS